MSESHVFRPVPAKGLLKVPIAVTAPFPSLEPKSTGTNVRQAELLLSSLPSAPATLAPAGGTVGVITAATLTTGRETPAIQLTATSSESDVPSSATTSIDGPSRLKDHLRDAKPADIGRYIDAFQAAGVWADRWTSPDLLGQLHQCLKRPVDTILCNALDFDAALPLQRSVAGAYATEVVAAVAMLAALTGASRAAVVLDVTANDVAKSINRAAVETDVSVIPLRHLYPQPNPTLLLHTVTKRQLRPGRLPTEAGAVVLDAVAAAAAGRCLLYGEPAVRALIGIADMRGQGATPPNDQTRLLSVPVGMSLADVLRSSGLDASPFELRASSPFREMRISTDCVSSVGGEVAMYLVAPQPQVNPSPCIRCGWCATGCPVRIHPADILQAAQTGDRLAAERHGIDSCIDCGVCSYVCPSNLPLLAGVRSLRVVTN